MLANLLDNALRYNTAGGDVDVVTGIRDGHGVLTVTNTGAILSRVSVAQLGQPFQRLGNERIDNGEGLGLGLSIVQAIADAHGATLDLQPRPTGGLAVQVAFPLEVTPATAVAERRTSVDAADQLAALTIR
jgi:signal transduction histidine kinase